MTYTTTLIGTPDPDEPTPVIEFGTIATLGNTTWLGFFHPFTGEWVPFTGASSG